MIPRVAVFAVFFVTVWGGCTPVNTISRSDSRTRVPAPGSTEWSASTVLDSAGLDSLTKVWTASLVLPDPLIGGENNARVTVRAVYFGPPLIKATIMALCATDSLSDLRCDSLEKTFRTTHFDSTSFRVDLNLESNFSENSLQPRFWDIFFQDADGIMYEPTKTVSGEVVAVKRDTLAAVGKPNILGGPYRRTVSLYFPRISPVGTPLVGPETEKLRLIFSRMRMRLGEAVWLFGDRERSIGGRKQKRVRRMGSY